MATAGAEPKPRSVFADLSHWRKIDVAGRGVLDWLGSQLDVDVSDLAPGRAHSAGLRQGGIPRFTVSAAGGSLLLLQDAGAPSVLKRLAAAAVEAGVTLEDRSAALALFAFPQRERPPDVAGTAFSAPSCLSDHGTGIDVVAMAEDHARLLDNFRRRFRQVEADQLTANRSG